MPRGIKGSGKADSKPGRRKKTGVQEAKPVKEKKTKHTQVDVLAKAKESAKSKPPKTPRRPKRTEEEILAQAEAELIQKYPARKIQPGSLKPAGAVPEFPGRRTVVIACEQCGAARRVCTSDLFHVSKCTTCTRKGRSKKKDKDQAKPE